MTKIKALIIDDEQHAIDMLGALLEHATEPVELCGQYQDPRKALTFDQWYNLDVLFIDIQMPFMNAFAFLEQLGPISASIVFTTAFDQYALDAVKMGAEDYLLKPIAQSDLNQVLARIAEQKRQKELRTTHTPVTRICVPNSNGFQILELSDIVWLEASNSYTYVNLKDQEKPLLISRTLKSFENKLDQTSFIRINQSVIINSTYVDVFNKRGGSSAILKNGKEFTITPIYRKRFMEAFDHLML